MKPNEEDQTFTHETELREAFADNAPSPPALDVDRLLKRAGNSRTVSNRALVSAKTVLAMGGGMIACSLVALMILWSKPSLSFAQVKQQVAATSTVSYVGVPRKQNRDRDKTHAQQLITEANARIEKLDSKLAEDDVEDRAKLERERQRLTRQRSIAENYLANRGDKPPTRRVFISGRYRQRTELQTLYGKRVSILNMQTGTTIELDVEGRVATVFKKQVTVDRATGEASEAEIEPDLSVDFYSSIRRVPENATRLAETKMIDGRKLIGFRASEQQGEYTWTRTFWVDEEKKLPREIEISAQSDTPGYHPSDAAITEIQFDEPLDDSLFDTNVPAGYTVRESKFLSL